MQLIASAPVLLALASAVLASHEQLQHQHKRATSPDNTCGSKNGFSCDPKSPNGGPCCSASGFCGSTEQYCGAGCQSGFGTCGSSSGSDPSSAASPAASSASAVKSSAPASSGSASSGACQNVEGAGVFSNHVTWDFTTLNALPSDLVATTEKNKDPTAPYERVADPSLSTVSGGYLNMKVPGGQSSSPIKTAQLQTKEEGMLFASIRTTAILSSVQGICHGFFFYNDAAEEIDIEYLSDPKSTSNPGDGSTPLQLTNHGVGSVGKQYDTAAIPSDATTKAHEYRTDWVDGTVSHYIDGKKVKEFTQYVPKQAGEWIWNNWADGNKDWSLGPPAQDSTLKISKIEMFYNTTSSKC